jgi:hypothetical protein
MISRPLLLDGKCFAQDSLVVALGITVAGEKRPWRFVQTATENERALAPFLRSLIVRGLDPSQRGLLVVIDAAKGLLAAATWMFEGVCLTQRCQWHKRENVVWYRPRGRTGRLAAPTASGLRASRLKRGQMGAYPSAPGTQAVERHGGPLTGGGSGEDLDAASPGTLCVTGREFKDHQQHRIEALTIRALRLEGACRRNSDQKQRWLAGALPNIESRLRNAKGFRPLPMFRFALQREFKLNGYATIQAA